MKRRTKSILIALALGDGYIQQQGKWATLRLQHCQAQLPYLLYKVDLLHSILGGKKPKIHQFDRYDKRTNRVYKSCLATKGHRYFRIIRKILYPKGKKTYSQNCLKYLDEEGLAIWYCDDGHARFYLSKRTGKISSLQCYLSTYCTLKEAKAIQRYFLERWGILFKYFVRHNKSYIMCANTKDAIDFIELIKPYIIPLFEYKIRPINMSTNASLPKGKKR